MSEHTPGPWLAEQDDFGDGDGLQWTVVHDGTWPLIAGVYGTDGADNAAPRCEANARLIAAAPDLLAALEAVVSAHERVEPETSTEEKWRESFLGPARAAIAKAKGGTAS